MNLEVTENEETITNLSQRSDSPILNSGKLARKMIMNKLKRKKKSRVRLADRFEAIPSTSKEISCELPSFESNDEDIENKESGDKVKTDDIFKVPCISPRISLSPLITQSSIVKQEISVNPNTSLGSSPRFTTALGRPITLSEEKIRSNSKLFNDILNNDQENVRERKLSFLSKAINKQDKHLKQSKSQNLTKYAIKEALDEYCHQGLKGFEQYEVQKARSYLNAFMVILRNPGKQQTESLVASSEFKAGPGNDIATSEKAPNFTDDNSLTGTSQHHNLEVDVDHVEDNDLCSQCVHVFDAEKNKCSLKTAVENKIDISEDALKKSQDLLEIPVDEVESKEPYIISQDGGGSKRTQDLLDSNLDQPPCAKRVKSVFELVPGNGATSACGFTSASGKTLTVSGRSLKMSKKLSEDSCEPDAPNESVQFETSNVGFKTAYGSRIQISDNALKRGGKLLDLPMEDEKSNVPFSSKIEETTSNFGFTSASGKTLTVSGRSLKMSEKLYKDSCEPYACNENMPFETSNVGFQTASGSRIQISGNALKRGGKLLDLPMEDEKSNVPFTSKIEETTSNFGFTSASGKTLTVSGRSLKMSEKLYKDSCEPDACNENMPFETSNVGFQTASGSRIQISDNALKRGGKLLDLPMEDEKSNVPFTSKIEETTSNFGFTSASGKTLTVSGRSLKISEKLYKDSCEPDACNENMPFETSNVGFQTASGSRIQISDNALKRGGKLLDLPIEDEKSNVPITSIIEESSSNCGFSSASGKKIRLSENALKKFEHVYMEVENESLPNTSGSKLNSSESSTKPSPTTPKQNTSAGFNNSIIDTVIPRKIEEIPNSDNTLVSSETLSDTSFENVQMRKRRLGVSRCKQIAVGKDHLERAKLMFVNNNPPVESPLRPATASDLYNSTPVRPPTETSSATSTPIRVRSFGNNDSLLNSAITPIKSFTLKDDNTIQVVNDLIEIKPHTVGDREQWVCDFERGKQVLQEILARIVKRQEALDFQQSLVQQNNSVHRGKRKGVLSIAKGQAHRIKLQEAISFSSTKIDLGLITPKSSVLVHFNCKRESSPVINTADGAIVVPNHEDSVGLSEIEAAFTVMPGVDVNLIPNGWIKNHYKWVVWKLASYENKSSDFEGCLSIENVMQQLKYRYDKEIDNAERPTLRKIMETDDVPQKRMVLCISEITKIPPGKFELELTDGWYSVRTLLDVPLCKQIVNGKLRVGTKLLICGAELMNCEGCHPLEATNMVSLKIGANSTRRTVWCAKLGYQICLEAFPIKLSSILPDGGIISAIKVAIARVYPVRYMERQESVTIWRNKKAEDKRLQEWENEQVNRIEEIQEDVRRIYEKIQSKAANKFSGISLRKSEIAKIVCPQTLYEIYESTNDPEWLQEMLTPAQWKAIVDHQRNISEKRNAEMQAEIDARIRAGRLNARKKDVASVLKLVVLDCLEESDQHRVFQIWNPTEHHMQILKEGSVFTVHNVIPKKNGELSSISRTKFRPELQALKSFQRYKRRLTSIYSLWDLNMKHNFNEFDTVGVVVQCHMNSYNQILWLADITGRLLVLKVYDGPQNCCIFDNIKRGQIIAASNLSWLKLNKDFAEAIVTQVSVISHYPRAEHLSDALQNLNENLPENLEQFLDECDVKISLFIDTLEVATNSSNSLINSSNLLDETVDESTLTYTGITKTDMALCLMDIDKFL